MKRFYAFALCFVLTSCGDREAQLPHGYKYVHISATIAAIGDRDNLVVVDPNVSRYEIIEPYLVGERTDAQLSDKFSKHLGYFILDMRNRELIEGLSKAGLESRLRDRGIRARPFE